MREKLGIGEFAVIELQGDQLVIKRLTDELALARPIARNVFEVVDRKTEVIG